MNSYIPSINIVLCIALVAGALLPLLATLGKRFAHSQLLSLLTVCLWILIPCLVVATAFYFRGWNYQVHVQPTNRPIEVSSNGYVSSKTCRSCHPNQHATWHQSYHRTMTQVAGPSTVIGDFNDRLLSLGDKDYLLRRKDDRFFVNMENPAGDPQQGPVPRIDVEIVMTTGLHHMQAYWFATEASRLTGMLPFVFLSQEKQWIPTSASFLRPPSSEVKHDFGRWNLTCLKCHTTHPKTRVENEFSMDTTVGEFGIACESCHGPGEEHVRRNQDPRHRYQLHLDPGSDQSIVNPLKLPADRASQICGQCHSIWIQSGEAAMEWQKKGFQYRPGDDLHRARVVVNKGVSSKHLQRVLRDDPDFMRNRFWPDGMVRVSGREYNGLLQSSCHERGNLSCLTCHNMHESKAPLTLDDQGWADDQLKPFAEDNRSCLKCHEDFRESKKLTAHTHHLANSQGSQCYNCHMPHTTYGLLKAIRSHQIDSPNVQTSLATGRPNACNLCHLDQTLAWTAEHLGQWYGEQIPEMNESQRTVSAAVLHLLSGDAGQRALLAWALGWSPAQQVSGTDWMAPYLGQLLNDPYEAVRFIARRSLQGLPGQDVLDYDFVGPVKQRVAASQRILQQWSGQVRSKPHAALLIDAEGKLNTTLFEQLLRQRDDRPLRLAE